MKVHSAPPRSDWTATVEFALPTSEGEIGADREAEPPTLRERVRRAVGTYYPDEDE